MTQPFSARNKHTEQDKTIEAAPVKNYITPIGYKNLHNELKSLIEVERPEVVKVVSWAASNGDRSENGDYIYGKKRLREIDKRIRFLNRRLAFAQIINPADQENTERVFFGATVTLIDDEDNKSTYRIVGIDEANAEIGDISWISPLAKALLKRNLGDEVTLTVNEKEMHYEIDDIQYYPS